jgi:hypothetical protein
MPLAIQQQILVLLQQLQARLTPTGDQSVSCEPNSAVMTLDSDFQIYRRFKRLEIPIISP